VRRALLLAGAMVAGAAPAPSQPAPAQPSPAPSPAASAVTSVEEVSVGERFHVDVSLSGPEGTRWILPETGGDDAVELVRLPRDPEQPLPRGTYRYRAIAFALDEVEVPAISVGYRLPDGGEGEIATEPIPLRIRSLLPKDPEEQTLADIQPPRQLPIGLPFWILLGLVAAMLVAAAVAVWRHARQPKREPPPPPPVSADVEALAALDRLAATDHGARGAWREYYIELAQIAKRYLERRLHAPVLEMTTAEAGAFLRDHPDGQAVFPALRELAGAADQVKFARAGTQAAEAQRHLEAARGLVRQLEERLRPAPPPPAREPGMASRRAGGGPA
jgi:hypothetical protein